MVLCGADELYTDGPRSKAQKLLERCLQPEEFPQVHEIQRSKGFDNCLEDSRVVCEQLYVKKDLVDFIAATSQWCDVYGLMTTIISTTENKYYDGKFVQKKVAHRQNNGCFGASSSRGGCGSSD